MTIKQAVKKYSKELKEVTHIPQKEVEILISHLLEKNNIWLFLNYNKEFEKEKELKLLVKKRASNYPLEYLIEKASFYGEVFIVEEGVLIPRPETEILVEKAFEILKNIEKPKILEVGVGSGIISIMLAKMLENISVIAVDINQKALELARTNAKKHNISQKIDFRQSDLLKNVQEDSFDMIISNPPYIANDYDLPLNVQYEPSNALFGGNIGDELLKSLISQSSEKKCKFLLCEMGYDQKIPLEKYFTNFDIKDYSFYKDYESFDRGFILEFNKKEKNV